MTTARSITYRTASLAVWALWVLDVWLLLGIVVWLATGAQ